MFPPMMICAMSQRNDLKATLSGIGLGYRFRAVAAAAIKACTQAPFLRSRAHRCSASSIRVLMLRMPSYSQLSQTENGRRVICVPSCFLWHPPSSRRTDRAETLRRERAREMFALPSWHEEAILLAHTSRAFLYRRIRRKIPSCLPRRIAWRLSQRRVRRRRSCRRPYLFNSGRDRYRRSRHSERHQRVAGVSGSAKNCIYYP